MKKSILITANAPSFFINDLKKLGFSVDVKNNISQKETLEIIQNYTALLIRGNIIANKEIILKAKKLKYILRPGSGLDIVDLQTAKENNIKIINSPKGNSNSVAEHTVGMLLAMLNNFNNAFEEIKNYKWNRNKNTGIEIKGKTIGIIGYGNTGSTFAQKLQSFDTKIIAYDKYKSGFSSSYVQEVNEKQIFKEADIVSYHIPLTKETNNLINLNYISLFQKNVFLINTSRGQILNNKDLLSAIQSGKIRFACLDVLANENLSSYSKEEKEILNKLIDTKKVLITPHIAGKTNESNIKIFSILIDKLTEIDFL